MLLPSKTTYLLQISILFSLLMVLVNGRSLLGLELFGFRLGELITGFSIILYLFFIYKFKELSKNFTKFFIISNYLLLAIFIFNFIFFNYQLNNLYIFKSSVFIWYPALFYFGYYFFSKFELSVNIFYIGYIGLFTQYIFNVIYYPDFLYNFFNEFSDKVQFLKGSEIGIFFLVITFFSNKYFSDKKGFINLFILASSVYIPLSLFKSRSAGIAVVIYVVFELLKYRKNIDIRSWRIILTLFISIVLFAFTSHNLVDNTFEIEETDKAIAQVFRHKYVVSNTYDGEMPFIYYQENRFYSADGNLNWRLQLWQDIISNTIQSNNFYFGNGFNSKLSVFDDLIYSGLDGSNENPHNYFINIFARTGIIGLLIFLFYHINLFRQPLINFKRIEYLNFLLPLFFISMFDGSMENPYFATTFYFCISIFYSGLKSKRKEYTLWKL